MGRACIATSCCLTRPGVVAAMEGSVLEHRTLACCFEGGAGDVATVTTRRN